MIFRPTNTLDVDKTKFDPPTAPGIFALYEITPGYGWSGVYRVWLLEDFARRSPNKDSKDHGHPRLRERLKTATLEIPLEGMI